MFFLENISTRFPTPLISAASVIVGSLIGASCSWITTTYATRKNIETENKIVEDNRRYEYKDKINKICENVNIIRLDICNALFQSIRTLKYSNEDYLNKYPICINPNYSKVVASLTNRFDLKEMSYIYQLYGIIESLNKHIKEYYYYDKNKYEFIRKDCELFLKKLYGENYNKILDIDIERATYEELYDNKFTKKGYRDVLKKLDENRCFEIYEKHEQ
ncbi:hypothetical protein [Clostridium brassicae]|uniref:Lipoprotein n=1 Tax=Clostridium brassicae TaxID=2999072 RepID=A0ABT4D9W4_9CLOT|nr:hypothetical protein [Clostridium brassicae]MCY6959107.1 hypothetical protein [Clostridium brassicae]